ncbi:uncharacterized protein LOC134696623 [Mytilus trossulus]|uniref:uncharacterized protein LOC134696623 n=1 Tax=Mytilus trossulus TaxID=6551 RepID=UPI003006597E
MDNSNETETNSGAIAAIVLPFAVTISCCLSCCRYYMRNKNAKKLKNIRRFQQSRTSQLTNEQLQYRIIGLYHDNGNSPAIISNPETQTGCRNGWKSLANATSGNDSETNFPNDTAYTPTLNPPAYEDIINRNTAAKLNVSSDPRTHTVVDVHNGAVTNLADDTTSIPKENPPAYKDII